MTTTLMTKLKKNLQNKIPSYGTFINVNAPNMVEICGLCGMDFVVIDTEHGALQTENVENLVRVAEYADMSALVRVTKNDPKHNARLLDIGAHGIMVPMVSTPEEARLAVQSCKYEPMGYRGIGLGRGARWATIPNYFEEANKGTIVVCMCETKEHLYHIDEIVKTEGLDVIFVGTVDLSQSLGVQGQPGHPAVEEGVQRVLKACLASGIAAGITVQNEEEAVKRAGEGFLYIAILNDMRIWQKSLNQMMGKIKPGLKLGASSLK